MKLTDQEGLRLTQMMLAMRPDWTPNQPGRMLAEHNDNHGFPGTDFGHCIRALSAYATETRPDGTHAKRTPDIYPKTGKHWTSTAANNTGLPDHGPPRELQCPEHDLPENACKSQHYATPPPDGWKTWLKEDPGATLPPHGHTEQPHQLTGGDMSADNDPSGTSTHNAHPEPPSPAKNQNGATP